MHPTFQFDINSKISGLAPNLDDYENLLVAIKQIKKYQIFKLHNEIQALLGALDLNQHEKVSAFFKVVFCDDIQLMNSIRELNLSEPYPKDEQLSDYLNGAEWPDDVYPMAFQLRHAYFLGKYEFSSDPKSKPTSHAITWLEYQNDKNAASRYIVDFSYLDQALLPVMKKLFSEAKLKNQQYLKVAHDCIGLTQFEIMQYIYGYVNHYQKHHQLPKLPDEVDCTLTEAQSEFINVYTARELREHCLRHDIEQVLIHFEANKNAFYNQFEMPIRKTAAMIAIEEKNTKLAEVLLAEDESFAAKKNIFGNHCLHYAIHHLSATHDEHLFRAWVKKYPNLINLPNNNGETPVYWAVLFGNTRFLSILLEEGASITEISQTGMNVLELALAKSRVVDVQLILYFQLVGDFNQKLIANSIKKIPIHDMFFASVNESIRNFLKTPTQMTDAQKLSFKRELLRGLTERHYCPPVQEKLIRAGNDDAYLTLLLRTLPNYQQLTNDERWAQILKIENEAKTLRGLSDRLFLMLSYKKPGDVNAELYYQVYRLIKDNNMIDLANVMHHFPTLKKLMTMLESHLTPLQSALQENDVETLKLILMKTSARSFPG